MTKLLERSIMAAVPAQASATEPSGALSSSRAVSLRFSLLVESVADCAGRLDRLSGAAAVSEKWRAIHLDTPDHAIANLGLGFGLRRRESGKRNGWRRFVAPLSAATPRTARRELSGCLRHAAAIDVVARVETQRRIWSFSCADALVEARLDRTSAVGDGAMAELASLSLACDAPSADFYRVVAEFCLQDGLRLSAESDLARAFRLGDASFSPYVTGFAPKLDIGMDAAEGFRAIASACFDHFLLNETAIRARDDHEAVHQCRVALRRLSACLRFFSDSIGGEDFEALGADLKELGTYLRDARDLDVMIADVIAPALAVDPPPGADALMHAIEARREKAHAALVARLRAPASAALFLRFAIWLEAGDWTRSADPKSGKRRAMSIAAYAQRKFERLSGKFAGRCAELAEMNQEERHKTRIHAKNLRYDAEFMTSLARSKTAGKRLAGFVQAVKKLQTVLGDWNDLLMARRFLTSLGAALESDVKSGPKSAGRPSGKRPDEQIAAAHALAQRITGASEAEFAEKSAKACHSLGKVKPFWAKLG